MILKKSVKDNELKNKSIKSEQNSVTLIDVIIRIKHWILSLTIIALLTKIFKNYKSIRAILKVANYIILTMFGVSLFEAFGFGFIIKLIG